MTKTYIIDRLELVFVRQVDRCSELVLCGLYLNKVRCCHPGNNGTRSDKEPTKISLKIFVIISCAFHGRRHLGFGSEIHGRRPLRNLTSKCDITISINLCNYNN